MSGLLWAAVVRAEPQITVQVEVDFLLGYVEGSGCEFYRNGTWHDSKAAQAHLRDKYRYLAARGLINSTEDFIEKVATQSSFSGEPYRVKCQDGATVTTNQWLRAELARFRASNKKPSSSQLFESGVVIACNHDGRKRNGLDQDCRNRVDRSRSARIGVRQLQLHQGNA
jgi:hypothetical protein